MIARRLGSARAVKTSSATASASGRVGIEVLDELAQLTRPAFRVALERSAVAVVRQLGEARFGDGQPRTAACRFQRELDVGAAGIVFGQAGDSPGEAED